MKEIRVLQLIDSLNVGGAEVLAVNIANGLANKGIESHLCATRDEGDLKSNINNRVGYCFLNRNKIVDFKSLLKLRRYINKNKITIIHAHSTSSFIAFCLKLLIPSIDIIWHDHFGDSEFLNKRKKYPLRVFSYFFKAIIVVNKKLQVWSEYNLLSKKVIFVNNFPLFNDVSKKTNLKGEQGKRIVHLAGFRPQKDHLNLLKAFKTVLDCSPNWTLHLVGKRYENNYSDSICEYINQYNLHHNIFLYDVCSDIKYILNQAEIGVLSSKSEGLPISLLEYGLAKICVLTTDVGECRNVVKNEKAIVAPQRSDKFAEKLKLLMHSSSLRNEIATNFSKEVLENYSEIIIINKLIKIYNIQC